MAYGTILADVHQSSTAGTPPVFNDGSGNQVGTLCRAWVAYSTATVSASFNVSSITANATGDYTINFTTAMPDTNYASVGTFGDTTRAALAQGLVGTMSLAKTTGSVRVTQQSNSGAGSAGNQCAVAIFR